MTLSPTVEGQMLVNCGQVEWSFYFIICKIKEVRNPIIIAIYLWICDLEDFKIWPPFHIKWKSCSIGVIRKVKSWFGGRKGAAIWLMSDVIIQGEIFSFLFAMIAIVFMVNISIVGHLALKSKLIELMYFDLIKIKKSGF